MKEKKELLIDALIKEPDAAKLLIALKQQCRGRKVSMNNVINEGLKALEWNLNVSYKFTKADYALIELTKIITQSDMCDKEKNKLLEAITMMRKNPAENIKTAKERSALYGALLIASISELA